MQQLSVENEIRNGIKKFLQREIIPVIWVQRTDNVSERTIFILAKDDVDNFSHFWNHYEFFKNTEVEEVLAFINDDVLSGINWNVFIIGEVSIM